MKLSEYLKHVKKSPEQFGPLVGVTGQAVRRYIDGTRFPRPGVLRGIAKATGNEVTAADFLDALPKKRARSSKARAPRHELAACR